MIHAYSKYYLDDACNLLGSYFDIAVNEYHYSITTAWKKFVFSDISSLFEKGNPFIISGLSGSELFDKIAGFHFDSKMIFLSKSPEYWFGYYLAYYQWCTSVRFGQVDCYLNAEEILDMYKIYHEMDVMHFVEHINELINQRKTKSNLEMHRLSLKYTRKELSEISGISIRTIEQYEQGLKDINNAKASTVLSLARALLVDVEDILELTKI